MNILLINHYAGSPRHGMEYRPFYMAREWVDSGHNVTIVASSESHLRRTHPQIDGTLAEEEIDGVRYLWLKTSPYDGNTFSRVKNIMAFVVRLCLQQKSLACGGQFDVVIASSTYLLDIFPARRIARRNGAMLIYEVHDLWPLSPMELGGYSKWHPYIMLLQHAENVSCRDADLVVSMLPKAKPHLVDRGMAPEKFVYVPNGIHPKEWDGPRESLPREHRVTIEKLKDQGRFLVGYTGSHGPANSLDTLIQAADLLRDVPVAFVLVGEGPHKAALQRQVQELRLPNVVFLPRVSRASVPSVLEAVDATCLAWAQSPLYQYGISPNKLFDYMMASKPVLHCVNAGNDLVAESACGISVAPREPNALRLAVQQLMATSVGERLAMGQRGRDYVLAHHSYPVLAEHFINAIMGGRSDREEQQNNVT